MEFENPACVELFRRVPSDWSVLPLCEVTDFQEGPGILAKDFCESGVPLLRLRNIDSPVVQLSGCNFLNEEKVAKKWSHFKLREGDLLISTSASLGRVSVVGIESSGSIAYTGIIRFRSSSDRLHHEYLRAFLSSKIFVEQAEKMASGSVIRHFGPSHLKQMAITLPTLSEQIRIAEIFDSLDNRITLLRETNKTLEAIAQAIFKSWFIDFDPVRAKMEGRLPSGMDEETAALFPNQLIETELGLMPEGWRVQGLDQIANYLNGLALQKFPPTGNDDLPVIKIAQLRKGDSVGADKASRAIKPEYIVKDGDVLFSWSGSLEVEIWCGGEGALNQHLFKVSSSEFSKWFYFLWTRNHLDHFRQVAASKATTMGHIQRSHLSEAKVVVPDGKVLAVSDRLFQPIIDRIITNSLQAKALTEIRDTLMPRLISGKLRIATESTEGVM
jgi:type I restriction enzyme S subunit